MGRGKSTPQDEAMKLIVSSNIRKFLNEKRKKAIDLQKNTGISQSSISEYINGKSLPNPGNLQKIADFFNVLREDIDPRHAEDWEENIVTSDTVQKITEISSQLTEPRQKVVLSTAKAQKKEQDEQNNNSKIISINKKNYTDEELMDIISRGVASDGTEQTEAEKEFFFNLIKNHLEGKNED